MCPPILSTNPTCLEGWPVSVEEELVPLSVPVEASLGGVAKKRVGEAGERAQLGLVSLPADVHDHPLTAGRRAVVVVRKHLAGLVLRWTTLLARHAQRTLVPTPQERVCDRRIAVKR